MEPQDPTALSHFPDSLVACRLLFAFGGKVDFSCATPVGELQSERLMPAACSTRPQKLSRDTSSAIWAQMIGLAAGRDKFERKVRGVSDSRSRPSPRIRSLPTAGSTSVYTSFSAVASPEMKNVHGNSRAASFAVETAGLSSGQVAI
jgi:hypothetical protein